MVKCGVLFEVRTEFLNVLDELLLQRVKEVIHVIDVFGLHEL
jgi:hypothetical protein